MEDEEDEWEKFNMESCEATAELEAAAREGAIGRTLYQKSWVLNVVLAAAQSEGTVSEEVAEDAKSLAEMAAESEVCQFLMDVGCVSPLSSALARAEDSRLAGPLASILAAVLARSDSKVALFDEGVVFQALLGQYYASTSAEVVEAVLRTLKSIVDDISGAEDVDDDDAGRRSQIIRSCFLDADFTDRTAFLLSSSTSVALLEAAVKLVFALFEVCLERLDEEDDEGHAVAAAFGRPDFAAALVEAAKQCGREKPAVAFHVLEILGHLTAASPACLLGVETGVCDLAAAHIDEAVADGDVAAFAVAAACRVCSNAWQTVAHQPSRNALSSLKETLASAEEDESCIALLATVEGALAKYQAAHDLPDSSKIL